jgi:hypothetical protein
MVNCISGNQIPRLTVCLLLQTVSRQFMASFKVSGKFCASTETEMGLLYENQWVISPRAKQMNDHTKLISVSDKPLGMAGQWCAPVSAGYVVARYVATAFAPTHIDAVTCAGSSDG